MLLASSHGLFLAVFRARAARRRAAHSPVPDPARLRPRIVLSEQARQRLGRPRARRLDGHALRSLAALPRDPSRLIGQSRPARDRRHQDPDGARIFRPRLARPADLSALPPSAGDVRARPGLYVPDREPAAFRLHAQRRHAMGQHHDHQRRDRGRRRSLDPLHGLHDLRASSMCRSSCWPRRWACGCSTCSINSRRRPGTRRRTGASLKPRCTAARITTCRCRCAGSAPISACITCTTFRAAFRFIGFPRSCAPIPSSAASADLPCGKALFASVSRLWDEDTRRMLSFREARAARRLQAG